MISDKLAGVSKTDPIIKEEIFDIQYYVGNGGSARQITSPVNLASNGGLVIVKCISNGYQTVFIDTNRGVRYELHPDSTLPQAYNSDTVTSFLSNGFTVGGDTGTNYSGFSYSSYAFRKLEGFFDIQTWTGNNSNRTIPHNLGVKPELMIIKCRSDDGVNRQGWAVWARPIKDDVHNYDLDDALLLNSTSALLSPKRDFFAHGSVGTEGPQDTYIHIGQAAETNASGFSYVGYFFASRQGLSKIGGYVGNGSSQTIDCGFDAGVRFVMIKRIDSTSDWSYFDTSQWASGKGIVAGNDSRLEMNTANTSDESADCIDYNSTGFTVNYVANDNDDINISGADYIYMAIA